jgi:hypothetical protein
MTTFGNADIPTMLTDWGNIITVNGISAPCALDDGEELMLEFEGAAGQIIRRIIATIQDSAFPDLAANDAIEIDGIAYIVWQRMKSGDGATAQLWLRKAEES